MINVMEAAGYKDNVSYPMTSNRVLTYKTLVITKFLRSEMVLGFICSSRFVAMLPVLFRKYS